MLRSAKSPRILAGVLFLLAASFLLLRSAAQSGGATVHGVVKYTGSAAPKAAKIDMSADAACAKLHSSAAMTEDAITASDGGLENAVVYVSDGLNGQTFNPPDQPVVVEQSGCIYKPHVIAMQANQKLEVVNKDPVSHNIHPLPNNNREWNKSQPPGVPVEATFTREEIAIPVKCNIHPWMHSYIAVFKNPFYAVTAKDGSFDIKNLPPGTYTLQVWHEKLGMSTQRVTVAAGETKAVDFTLK